MIQVNEEILVNVNHNQYQFKVASGDYGFYLRSCDRRYGNDVLFYIYEAVISSKEKFCYSIHSAINCEYVFPECPTLEILKQLLEKLFTAINATSNIDWKLYPSGHKISIF